MNFPFGIHGKLKYDQVELELLELFEVVEVLHLVVLYLFFQYFVTENIIGALSLLE